MTTIAFDGTYMAADRRCINNGLGRVTRKLWKSSRYVYGSTGMIAEGLLIWEWLRDGADPAARPQLAEEGGNGLVYDLKEHALYHVDGGKVPVLVPVTERRMAAGSGRDYALAAMALGLSARQAVTLASRFDLATGGGVHVVRCKLRKPKS